MKSFFEAELAQLRQEIIQMAASVEQMFKEAAEAFVNGNEDQAREAILADKKINAMENKVVNQAILLMATNQPVAGDLRFLASSLRLATEIERMGDLAANVARRAIDIQKITTTRPIPPDLLDMLNVVKIMISEALDSFTRRDPEKAQTVLEKDDAVDDYNRDIRRAVMAEIERDGSLVYWGLEMIFIAMHLERMGDHATNLAEETIYTVSGRNMRHGGQI